MTRHPQRASTRFRNEASREGRRKQSFLLPLGDEARNARPEPNLRLKEPVVVFAGGLGLLRIVQDLYTQPR